MIYILKLYLMPPVYMEEGTMYLKIQIILGKEDSALSTLQSRLVIEQV
jgi:hypothetical protein